MSYIEKDENMDDLLNTLELKYTNNHFLDTLEKKYNKLINTEINPHIEVILCQYYLVILGGDYINIGLLNDLKLYLNKLSHNKILVESIDILKLNEKDKNRLKELENIILKNEIKYKELYLNMMDSYNIYIKISKDNIECSKYNLHQLHTLQLITCYNVNNNIENKEHIFNLTFQLEHLNKLLENEKDELLIKFIDSQISVIEQQFDLLKV